MSRLPDLSAASWLTDPHVVKIIDVLEGSGYPARFVGGAVRNGLLGLPVADLDLATTALPATVMLLAREAGLSAHPTGIDHGTVTLVNGPMVVEVTTLRKDVETHGRRAVVAFTEDWSEDAMRRDFTINALYCDRSGTVFEPLGSGLEDLRARRVRFIGDANDRIHEDYLRILRFFRFFATYADGE
ncbi:MAG: CCA tRNA nucleotidyltransferase, partial [Pseudomonadota bacterium]